jgi:nitroreductase
MSFIKNLSWRYATKMFDSNKKVESVHLEKILEAVRLAPTSFGLQPFHVTVVENQEIKDKLQGFAWNQAQVGSSSQVLVFSYRTDVLARINTYFEMISGGNEEIRKGMEGYETMMKNFAEAMSEEKVSSWAAKQAYIALGFALAACTELEIDSCPMEGFDPVAFKEVLELPENITPVVILPIGYRSEGDTVRAKVRFSETDLFSVKK